MENRFPVPHDELTRFLPIRCVFRRGEDDALLGITEESWCMAESRERVNVFWSGKAYSILGEHQIDGISDAKRNAGPDDIVVDPLADDSPVEINWRFWLDAMKAGSKRKYDARNAPFFVRESNSCPGAPVVT